MHAYERVRLPGLPLCGAPQLFQLTFLALANSVLTFLALANFVLTQRVGVRFVVVLVCLLRT